MQSKKGDSDRSSKDQNSATDIAEGVEGGEGEAAIAEVEEAEGDPIPAETEEEPPPEG